MAVTVIMGALAAFGAFCGLWVLAGWLLTAGQGGITVLLCVGKWKPVPFVRRWCFLRELGLFRGELLLVDLGMTPGEKERLENCRFVEICRLEELESRLELERNQIERTGT